MKPFFLRQFVANLKAANPNGLTGEIKVECYCGGSCRWGKTPLAANFVPSGRSKSAALVVKVDGIDGPVNYMCYRDRLGGKMEPYVDYLVREHGFDRYTCPELDAPEAIPLISPQAQASKPQAPATRPRPSAPSSRSLPERRAFGQAEGVGSPEPRPRPPAPPVRERPPAPAPRERKVEQPRPEALATKPSAPPVASRPPAPAPRERKPSVPTVTPKQEERPATKKSTLPPRRSIGQAEGAGAGDNRPQAPASRGRSDRRDEHPAPTRWTPPAKSTPPQGSPKVTIGDAIGGLSGLDRFRARYKNAEEAKAAKEAEEYQAYLGSLAEMRAEAEAADAAFEAKALAVRFCGAGPESKPLTREERRALDPNGWKRVLAVTKIGNGKPVIVAACTADDVVEHAVQSEVATVRLQSKAIPPSTRDFAPTSDAGTVSSPVPAGPVRLGFKAFEEILVDMLDWAAEKDEELEGRLADTLRAMSPRRGRILVELARLWDAAIDTSAVLDQLHPERVEGHRKWEEIRKEIHARRAEPAPESVVETVSPEATTAEA